MNHSEILLNIYGSVFESDEQILILNYPNHFNTGDHAIFLGELAIFETLGITIRGVFTNHSFERIEDQIKGIIAQFGRKISLVLHGGGSFGGIWPSEERARLHYLDIARRLNLKFVQLPQTVNFTEQVNLLPWKQMESGSDTTLMVRDNQSFHWLQDEGIPSILSPDSVHFLDFHFDNDIKESVTILKRRDFESTDEFLKLGLSEWDWRDTIRFREISKRNLLRLKGEFENYLPFPSNKISVKTARQLSLEIVLSGLNRISRSQVLITDRLHGVLLGTLIEKDLIIVDDSHHKISNYLSTWMTDRKLWIFSNWQDAMPTIVNISAQKNDQ